MKRTLKNGLDFGNRVNIKITNSGVVKITKNGEINIDSIRYRRKMKKELTADAQKHFNSFRLLLKGTRVTVKEIRSGWARIPSGWVSMQYLKRV